MPEQKPNRRDYSSNLLFSLAYTPRTIFRPRQAIPQKNDFHTLAYLGSVFYVLTQICGSEVEVVDIISIFFFAQRLNLAFTYYGIVLMSTELFQGEDIDGGKCEGICDFV